MFRVPLNVDVQCSLYLHSMYDVPLYLQLKFKVPLYSEFNVQCSFMLAFNVRYLGSVFVSIKVAFHVC